MPTFEWICRECLIYWDQEHSVGKAPSKTDCPKCGASSPRYWQNQNVAVSFMDDGCGNKNSGAGDYRTVRRRYEKHAEDGYDQQSGDRFLRRAIKSTKERTDSEAGKYKAMNLNYEKLAEDRGYKKLDDKQTAEKIETAKRLTQDAYNNATNMGYKDINETHLDITKPQKQQ